jgi:hypothetical protein
MADVIISITIKDENVEKIKEAFFDQFPKEDNFQNDLKKFLRKEIKRIYVQYQQKLTFQSVRDTITE